MEKTPQQLELILKYFDDFTPLQLQQFEGLLPQYKEWNEKINVISRKDIDSLYLHHVLHSLSIAAFAELQPGMRVIDIGTGGGFPGVPLAIFFPEVEFLLVDSIGKKLKVIDAVCETIQIKNVNTLHSRVENIQHQKFDFAVSRAVAPLKDLWKWAKPLIQKGHNCNHANGLICLKGGDLAQEIYESGLKPHAVSVFSLFAETYYQEKFLLHVPK